MKLLKWATAKGWMTACMYAARGNLRLVFTPSFSLGQSSKGHRLMGQASTDFWNPLRRALGLNTLVLKAVCWIVLKFSQVELTWELFSPPKGTLPALKTREEGSISKPSKIIIHLRKQVNNPPLNPQREAKKTHTHTLTQQVRIRP